MGTGAIDNPYTLAEAVVSSRVQPGDTLYLRGGTYVGDFTFLVLGTQTRPVTIRSYPGEWAVIDGKITLGYSDGSRVGLILRDLEIMGSSGDRGSVELPPSNDYRTQGVVNFSSYGGIINCIIHDGGVSISDWATAHDSIEYGNLIFNSGWLSSARGNGHATYCQNTTGVKTIKHNIMGPHFGRTLANYGTGEISGFRVIENVFVEKPGGNILMGSGGRMTDQQFVRNHIYGRAHFGYSHMQNGTLLIADNTIYNPAEIGAFAINFFEAATINGNRIAGKSDIDDPVHAEMIGWLSPADTTGIVNVWDSNEYHYLGELESFKYDALYKTWAQWQALGFDLNGNYDTSNPAWNSTTFYPNEYADADSARLGIAVVWNWAGAASVSLNLGGVIMDDAQVKVRSYLDYFNDIQTLTVANGAVAVDMQADNRTIAKPIGWEVALAAQTYPTFGAFVLESA